MKQPIYEFTFIVFLDREETNKISLIDQSQSNAFTRVEHLIQEAVLLINSDERPKKSKVKTGDFSYNLTSMKEIGYINTQGEIIKI